MKIINYVKAACSAIIWGFGQLLNRQYLKALFFFAFFAAFIGIELGTTNFTSNVTAYDKIEAEAFDYQFFKGYKDYYDFQVVKNASLKDEAFEAYYNEVTENGKTASETWNELNVAKYLAKTLEASSPSAYIDLTNNTSIDADEFPLTDYVSSPTNVVYYLDSDGTYYSQFTRVEGNLSSFYYKKVNPITNEVIDETEYQQKDTFEKYLKTTNVFASRTDGSLYFEMKKYDGDSLINAVYGMSATGSHEIVNYSTTSYTMYSNNYYLFAKKDGSKIYGYYEPGLYANGYYGSYKSNATTEMFKAYVKNQYESFSNQYLPVQYKKFLLIVYFQLDDQLRVDFESRFYNYFYDRAGLFTKSYWAVFTLGQTGNRTYSQYQSLFDALRPETSSLSVEGMIVTRGHVTVQVLLEGLIGVILSLFFFIFMIWSIMDAYRVSVKRQQKEKIDGTRAYFKGIYDNGFEYIILSPAVFVLAFISIMPIVFGFLLAFTSVTGAQAMNESFDWVGLSNFFKLFSFSEGLGSSFGVTFWKVLGWTLIWAVLSTATCFFGGLFQALILNSEHVVFRKFWRSILILPWAIPALLSQMVFSVMFKETGLMNQIMDNLGFYTLFRNLGILGTPENPLAFSSVTGIQKFFYLGATNIMWFNNADNVTFVRATLIVVNMWLGFPYFMALMSGIMTSIDKTLYEAAQMDGATKWQQTRKITFPLVLYSTAPILIMTFSGNFNNFGVIYFITQGGPSTGNAATAFAGKTDILISWMYKLTVDHSIYNMASVFSVLIFVVIGSITAWNLSRTRAFTED